MIDQKIQEALHDWRSIVKKYQVPNTGKAIIQMLNSFLPFVGLWTLMYFSLEWSYWITLALAVVNAFFLVRIFIIQHDCGHLSFLKSKQANKYIGLICSFFSSIPYRYWARMHNWHHGHNGQLETETRELGDIHFLTVEEFRQATPWRRFRYRAFRHPLMLFGITPVVYLALVNRLPIVRTKNWLRFKDSQLLNNLLIAGVYMGLALLIGWKEFLLIQIPVLFMFGVIAFWFFYVQHQHEETYKAWKKNWDHLLSSIRGSTYYKLPRLFTWLTGNIGYHHIHHLNPRIPNYHLKRCAQENPILQQFVTTLNFRESLKCMFNKLWDEQNKRMITFREFRRLEQAQLG